MPLLVDARNCHPYGAVFYVLLLVLTGCLNKPPEFLSEGTVGGGADVQQRIDNVLNDVFADRKLTVEKHAAWQVLHGVLAFQKSFEISTKQGDVPALQYLLDGGTLDGWTLETVDDAKAKKRRIRARMEPGGYVGQGHFDQWLAIIAQADLPSTHPVILGGHKYFLRDFLTQTQQDVPFNTDEEWSWTLIGLTQYLSTDSEWIAADGKTWSIQRLVGRELDQDLPNSTCGGTHRLIGLAMALQKRRAEQLPMSGVWREATELITEAARVAKELQNGDGSFSSNYLSRPGISADSAKVLTTTGHMLEFLALTLPAEELAEPWMRRAVLRICRLLEETRDLPLECGALYHAVHGLRVYRERAFGDEDQ